VGPGPLADPYHAFPSGVKVCANFLVTWSNPAFMMEVDAGRMVRVPLPRVAPRPLAGTDKATADAGTRAHWSSRAPLSPWSL
jgi:hypothetical protein